MYKTYLAVMLLVLVMAGAVTAEGEQSQPTAPIILTEKPVGRESPFSINVRPAFGSDSEQSQQIIGGVMTMAQSFEVIPISMRYRLNARDTISAEIPYIWRTQSLKFLDQTLKASGSGLGDVGLGFERSFGQNRASGWDGIIGLDMRLPTGRSIYDNVESDVLSTGTGHYELLASLNFRRIADPLFTNTGIGLSYTFPREYDDDTIRPGFGFTISSGIGFALNDRCVLVEQIEYTRRPNVLLQGVTSMQTEMFDQAYVTHEILYNPSKGRNMYSLRFSLGLNRSSTDYILSFAIER